MANRDRHRQGLIYGPVPPSGPRDRGRILGNLLGLLVLVVTVSVLGVAVYMFVQSRGSDAGPSGASPTPTIAAGSGAPSGHPSSSPSGGSSGKPSASATATAVAVVTLDPGTPDPVATLAGLTPTDDPALTPPPTAVVPPVMAGPGFITFGTRADAQYRIVDAKTMFGLDEPMVWSAYLTQPANSVDLRVRILIADPSQTTGERLIREDAVKPDARAVQIFFRRLRPIGVTAGSGLFTIQYVLGEQVLSQGSFLVQ